MKYIKFRTQLATITLAKDAVISVIGHGSWATAIVKILLENNNQVNWYVRNEEVREHLATNHTNPRYLSQVHFYTSKLNVCGDINEAIAGSQIVVLATPSAFIKPVMADLTMPLTDKVVISAIKGIVPDDYVTIAEYLNQTYHLPFDRIGIVTGPCHAEEVALERLSYLTMVCKDEDLAAEIGEKFKTDYINIITSTDIYGAEYGAVLKNIYAIAVGMCHAMGYGDNFLAVLISNATLEMQKFMDCTYPTDRNICNSAYLGDLLVTCYSQFSRNRTFGLMIGKGYSVRNAQMEMNMIAEGYYATACIRQVKNRVCKDVEMPIADAMYAILYERKSAAKEIKKILSKLK